MRKQIFIEDVIEYNAKNGREMHQVISPDLERNINIFDLHIKEALEKNIKKKVDVEMIEKNGYWNIKEVYDAVSEKLVEEMTTKYNPHKTTITKEVVNVKPRVMNEREFVAGLSRREDLIIRQCCVKAASELCASPNHKNAEVLIVAESFYNWIVK